MKRFVLDLERYRADGAIFPPDFDFPGPYFYHGTTGTLADAIEREGLRPASSGITRADCEAVLAVFMEINWTGSSLGGAPSLREFSLKGDLSHPRGDPLFLSEYPATASYYATRRWAGGEKTSALRAAIADLERLISDQSFRHATSLAAHERLNPTRPAPLSDAFSIDMVRDRLATLTNLRQCCQAWHDNHSHGLIYAIQLDDEFCREHCEPAGLALRVFAEITPDALKACIRLPQDFRPSA